MLYFRNDEAFWIYLHILVHLFISPKALVYQSMMRLPIKITLPLLMLMVIHEGMSLSAASTNTTTIKPNVVNIGAMVSFSSIIGKVARVALRAAVEDVNSHPSVLDGIELNLTLQNTNISGFKGIAEGMFSFLQSFFFTQFH